MKLPLEVRRRIYLGYFSNLFRYHEDTHILICRHDVSKCRCLRHDNSLSHAVDLQLARVSRTLRDEVLACWYETQKFYVNCGCELKELLTTNASLHNNIRFLKLHWTGPQSAAGFKLLADVPKLKSLVIVISKSTTNVLSARENELQKYFAHRFQARLTDALGFEELGALRGLTQIKVVHIDKSQTHRRTNEERCGLEAYLKDKMQAES
ncbi:hypothetical protein M406DRAFT_247134 [Cryphonectria parasitica EP155]|uniref:Uncharacterized protein n=1 Tax=Cryphonectria parasitica (strain ATCC 38755 / EP155) TaxID=660469 RepID=A0A9P5CSZ4_CRYP1|nr:uncharacterized protein M406DRAFT_247134 [Cryphonectria parasitica EP155]KAF3770119.1 hypothetical protein M406DRAFT_247134 [Cryphonectria parasitica EP155]